ncbi:LOW QUALITY PROTEIN: hypothetical protein AAY473_040474, partial [Plecturocebus cupreus]
MAGPEARNYVSPSGEQADSPGGRASNQQNPRTSALSTLAQAPGSLGFGRDPAYLAGASPRISLHPQPPGLKQASYLSFPSNWHYCYILPCMRQGLALFPRLEYSGMIIAHCSLLGSNYPSTSAPKVAGTTGIHHPCLANFWKGSHYVVQDGLELLTSRYPPALTFQSSEIMGMSHCTWPRLNCRYLPAVKEEFAKQSISINKTPEYLPVIKNKVEPEPAICRIQKTLNFYIGAMARNKTEFYHIGQAGLELQTSNDLPASACQNAEIMGMSHFPAGAKRQENLVKTVEFTLPKAQSRVQWTCSGG